MNREDYDSQIETQMYQPQQESFDTIRLRLDPTPTLELIRHSLLREHYDAKSETWVNPHNLRPMLTKEGTEDLMIDLTARMSVDKVLGNINDREFNDLLRQIGECVWGFLFLNAAKYEISEDDIDRINYLVLHNVRLFLSRARGGLENIHLSKQLQYREEKRIKEGGGPPDRGVFGLFGGGKK